MFTDDPVTPRRLEILVSVVWDLGARGTLRKDALLQLLQPEALPGFQRKERAQNQPEDEGFSDSAASRNTSECVLRAARELDLVEVDQNSAVRIAESIRRRKGHSVREVVLNALDRRILGSTEIEPYFAPFYSFLLGLGTASQVRRDDQEWANMFNTNVHDGRLPSNPLNKTKVLGLGRWYRYAGLGWKDTASVFHCEPYERLRRAVPQIFGDATRIDAETFMMRTATFCPELDGGMIFRMANPTTDSRGRVCTLGLSQALLSLHEDKTLVLHCPPDGSGWSLAAASPRNDGRTLRSGRLDAVEWSGSLATADGEPNENASES